MWLYGVAYRVIGHQWRSTARRRRLEDRLRSVGFRPVAAADEPVSTATSTASSSPRSARLGDTDAEVLRLVAWEQLSVADVAAVLGIDPNAAQATAAPCPAQPRSRVRPAPVPPDLDPRCSDRRCPVITEDEVMRLLERADPARRDDVAPVVDAAGYLDALRTRSTTVTLIDTEPDTDPTAEPSPMADHRRRRGAVVVIVVGALVLATRDDDDRTADPRRPPPSPPTTPAADGREIARGFLEADDAFDADRALTYLTDDARRRDVRDPGASSGWNSSFSEAQRTRRSTSTASNKASRPRASSFVAPTTSTAQVRRDRARPVHRQLLGSHHP